MNPVLITAIGVGVSTLFGSALGFFINNVSHKTNDTIIGFCSGVMLSAAILGLIMPAFEGVSNEMLWLPVLGVVAGALLLNILDLVTPHLHHITGKDQEEHVNNRQLNRVLLFVLAIALHKFPEGMAAGVGFNGENIDNAMSVAIGISIQNIPEGMVVISPLLLAGISRLRTALIAVAIGFLDVAGVFFGYYLGVLSLQMLPFMLSLAGGAMLYVVSDEMIPESHAHGYQKPATYALLAGFVLMVCIDRLIV